MAAAGHSGGLAGPPHKRGWKLLVRLWKGLNSAIVIALISSIVVLYLTKAYEAAQARSADLAKRRTELERLIVELDLRTDRLAVVCEQGVAGKAVFKPKELARIGQRAKAIVAGRSDTVTSDPAYQNFHLASLLSQAEVTAGFPLTHRPELMHFTDRTDEAALTWTPYILDQITDPIAVLERELNAGRIPIAQDERGARPTLAARQKRDPLLCGKPAPNGP